MKRLKSIVVISLLIMSMSCKSNDNAKALLITNDWKTDMTLDGNNKWIANNETTLGVSRMLNILENLDTSIEIDYAALGTNLKTEINDVIQKCSMKGPSYDNLQVFLVPLIEKVDALQESKSIEENKALVASTFYNLKAYSTYFK